MRVVHHRQRLAFVCKTGQHLTRIHSELYDFERHKAANRFALFGQVNGSHAAFAKRSKDVDNGRSRRQRTPAVTVSMV